MTIRECYKAAHHVFPFYIENTAGDTWEVTAGKGGNFYLKEVDGNCTIPDYAFDSSERFLFIPNIRRHGNNLDLPPIQSILSPEPPCTCPTELLGADHPGCAWGEWRRAK